MAPSKRKRRAAQEPGEDLISHLERDCLLHILSFLETRASVRTSVLSRSWRNLWSLVPAVDLSCPFPSFPADAPAHHVLDLEGQRQIWRFRLFVNYTMHDEQWQLARRWVRHALQRSPSHVELVCYVSDPSGELLPLVFSCTSMESLYLHHRVDHLPLRFQFARLKTLHIYDVLSNYGVLQQLILSSPDLEELHLVRCLYQSLNILNPGLKRLLIQGATYSSERHQRVLFNITAPELEWLSLHFTSVPEMLTIRGSAPNLCFFHCIAPLNLNFDLGPFVSLIRASVRSDGRSSRDFTGRRIPILQGLNGVKVLRLPYATLMVLSQVQHLPRNMLFPYQNLKYLELETHLKQYDIRALTLLLRSCSDIETFIIKVAEVPRWQVHYGLGPDWEPQELYDECSFYHLKTIKIHGFGGGLHGMEFMDFLLGRASNLQTVSLIYKKRSRHLRMANQFVEVLKTFLRARTAKVIFLTET